MKHSLSFVGFVLFVVRGLATRPGFPPSLKPGCLKADSDPNLFCPGDEGYGCYKIPTLLRTKNGTLVAMIEARKFSCDDQGYIDLRLRRSFDDGKTWGPSLLAHGNSTKDEWTTVGDASMVEDASTGIIWMIHTRNNTNVFLSSSRNQGESWSDPVDMTHLLKHGYPTQHWVGTGHAGGIQLSSGRLIVPTYSSTSYVVYSDDHGESWHMGDGPTCHGRQCGGENQVAEMEDGSLIMSFRNSCSFPLGWGCGRLQTYSSDRGKTWGQATEVKHLPEPIAGCEGSIVYHPGAKKLFFSHPDPLLRLLRTNLVVWSSADHGHTWDYHATVWKKAAGYSAMVVMGNSTDARLGMLYDRNDHTMLILEAQSVSFALIDSKAALSEELVQI